MLILVAEGSAHLQMRRQQRVAQHLAAHVVVLGDAELRFGPEAVPDTLEWNIVWVSTVHVRSIKHGERRRTAVAFDFRTKATTANIHILRMREPRTIYP